jgi:hypothetical protein
MLAMRWGRRILGWVWVASATLSVIVFVAAVGMWLRGQVIPDELIYERWVGHQNRFTIMENSRHGLRIWYVRSRVHHLNLDYRESVTFYGWTRRPALMEDLYPKWRAPTSSVLGYAHQTWAAPIQDTRVWWFPHWLIGLLSLPLPLIAFRRWRRKRRIEREGLCRVCGYDLRASVERCPECRTGFERSDVRTKRASG